MEEKNLENFWRKWIISLLIMVLIAGGFIYYYSCPKIILNLPRPPVDGETTWAFLVNGRERNPGDIIHVLKPFETLKIDVVELSKGEVPVSSGKVVDSFEMTDEIQDGDLLAYKYFSESSSNEESLAVVAYHESGVATLTFVDLGKEKKTWINFPNLGKIIDSKGQITDWEILINGEEIDDGYYPYHNGDEVMISIRENKSGEIITKIDMTNDLEEYSQIWPLYNEPSDLLNEGYISIFLYTPGESFTYDQKEFKVNIPSSLSV